MVFPRIARAALLLVLLSAVIAPRPAEADILKERWSLNGYRVFSSLGNTDNDPQPELLCTHTGPAQTYAVVDGATGVVQQEFPDFRYPDATCKAIDTDNDGRPELFFYRGSGGPPIFRAYRWDGTAYTQMYVHYDPLVAFSLVHVRSPGRTEMLEIASNNIRLRTLTGTVIWQASTALPGWTGNSPNARTIDVNGDGTPELLVERDASTIDLVRYSGENFIRSWGISGWLTYADLNCDLDYQRELLLFNATDGHFAVFDGFYGYLEFDLPAFSLFSGASMVPLDADLDGSQELYFHRPGPGTPLLQAFQGSAGGYSTLFSHNLAVTGAFGVTSRSALEREIVELSSNSVRIRDALTGDLLLNAPSQVFWPALTNPNVAPLDVENDGISELVVTDASGSNRLVKWSFGNYYQPWSIPGWQLAYDLGDADGDPADEYMMRNLTTGAFALYDGLSGNSPFVTPDWNSSPGTAYFGYDSNNDGVNEILSFRPSFLGYPARLRQYRSNGVGFVEMFTHTDPVYTAATVRMRGNSEREILEVTPDFDVLLRDGTDGTVLLRGSEGVPSWNGIDMTANPPYLALDLDADGSEEELIINEGLHVHVIGHYTTLDAPGSQGTLAFRVMPSSPNPFRSTTTLRFTLPREGKVGVRIFDTAGRLVRQLDRTLPAGLHDLAWDGLDEGGKPAPNGVLFYEITADGVRKTSRMVRMQ